MSPESATSTAPGVRVRNLELAIRSLGRAIELQSGPTVATQSALWEVQSARKRLVEVEASLRRRLNVIAPESLRSSTL